MKEAYKLKTFGKNLKEDGLLSAIANDWRNTGKGARNLALAGLVTAGGFAIDMIPGFAKDLYAAQPNDKQVVLNVTVDPSKAQPVSGTAKATVILLLVILRKESRFLTRNMVGFTSNSHPKSPSRPCLMPGYSAETSSAASISPASYTIATSLVR